MLMLSGGKVDGEQDSSHLDWDRVGLDQIAYKQYTKMEKGIDHALQPQPAAPNSPPLRSTASFMYTQLMALALALL